jgi:hypothetical protein
MPTAGIYLKLVRLQVRSQMQYPANFSLSLLATFLFLVRAIAGRQPG